jgi:hypothetical protein
MMWMGIDVLPRQPKGVVSGLTEVGLLADFTVSGVSRSTTRTNQEMTMNSFGKNVSALALSALAAMVGAGCAAQAADDQTDGTNEAAQAWENETPAPAACAGPGRDAGSGRRSGSGPHSCRRSGSGSRSGASPRRHSGPDLLPALLPPGLRLQLDR